MRFTMAFTSSATSGKRGFTQLCASSITTRMGLPVEGAMRTDDQV